MELVASKHQPLRLLLWLWSEGCVVTKAEQGRIHIDAPKGLLTAPVIARIKLHVEGIYPFARNSL